MPKYDAHIYIVEMAAASTCRSVHQLEALLTSENMIQPKMYDIEENNFDQ